MNGCAYCLDMHTKDLREMGETEQRLYVLPACLRKRLNDWLCKT
ncbi:MULTISPECIES: carboxymuconolactone decarboxylase family protein [Niastella]|nr:carboxymuconolactone decarboxylase family protein [Niastella soli]